MSFSALTEIRPSIGSIWFCRFAGLILGLPRADAPAGSRRIAVPDDQRAES
jgi:hypothetical protein